MVTLYRYSGYQCERYHCNHCTALIIHNIFTILLLCDSTVPSGAQGGPGNVNQSTSWHDVLDQSLLHTLTLLSPLATSHNSWPSILGNYIMATDDNNNTFCDGYLRWSLSNRKVSYRTSLVFTYHMQYYSCMRVANGNLTMFTPWY